ncbi:MAG: HYR domain-containing protein [Anaerolineales bacterium]|nr:HYR domain-containing protein [Anaerolineales bacterium]
MFTKSYSFRWVFSVLLVASIITVNVSVALADEDAPSDSTPTVQPSEESQEPLATEEIESPSVVETPTPEVGGDATPTPEGEETPSEEEQVPAAEEASNAPLFEQIPENTEVIVLDENGEALPLSSEEALDVILDSDPMWCPAGVLPGGPGCTTNFATINALLTNMRNNTSNYTQDGVIYFTSNPGASFALTTAGSSLGSGDFNTLNDFNLTLQGGWNGLNGASATFTGTTNFGSNTVTIGTSSNPWVGNITINNFSFNNVSNGNSLTVYTTSGDITLNNVTVTQQRGDDYTAYLDSQSGDIVVSNSAFDGNDSGGSANRNRGFRAETNTGSITISDTTFRDTRNCTSIIFFCLDETSNYNGATLSAPIVTLNNVTAFNNDLSGIEINNANSVFLNNVVSYENGTFILLLGLGSGVHVNGTGSTVVNVNGGTLSDNEAYGLSVFFGSISATIDPTCSGNTYPGPHPSQCYNLMPLDTTPPVLSLPLDMTVEATGPSGAVVAFSPTANDAADGSVPVTCSPASGSAFALGVTTVNCSASDSSGNIAYGSFNVTVTDTTPPILSLPADITTEAMGSFGAAVTFTASASDLVSGSVSVTCSPASGSAFALGATTVNCSASDSSGNIAYGSFNVTVTDTTPPVISPHEDVTVGTSSGSGTVVVYSPPATTDVVDGAGVAVCTPTSGSLFPVGITTVTCTATDSHGNSAAPVTFLVTVNYEPNPAATFPGGFIITVTGGELIDLECFTVVNAFGVKVTFHNLCEHQAVITKMEANTLPGQLPNGASFTQGLNVTVLFDGKPLEELPVGAGIQLDFPITANIHDQFEVLLWDNENKEWLDVTQAIKDEELTKALSADTEDELYRIAPTETTKALYRILTAEKTGTFVIVKK